MKAPFPFLALALWMALAAAALAQAPASAASLVSTATQETVVPLLSESRFLVGVNYPWYQQDGMHWFGNLFGEMTDTQKERISSQFREMAAAGLRVNRFWVLAGGGRWPERKDGAFQPLPEKYIEDFRWFVREAARFGIFSMPSIWDFYLNRDHRDWIADDTLSAQVVDTCIKPMVTALAHEPGLLIWDVMNEPEWTLKGRRIDVKGERGRFLERFRWGPDVGPGHDLSRVRAFLKRNVDAVHAAGGRATLGSVSFATVRFWRDLGLDEYQIHFYPVGQDSKLADEQFLFIPKVKFLRLDKPVMLGEFPPNIRGLDLTQFLERMRDYGYSGALPWAWMGDGYPENMAHPFSVKSRLDQIRKFTGK